MEEADKLCEQLFLWLEKQKKCTEKLLAAAQVLEDLHLGSNIVQAAGNAAAVGGFAALAIICTGGLAAPLAVPMAVAGIGTAVSLAPKAIESGVSLHTIKEAEQLLKDVEEIRDTIQTLLNELNVKCASQGWGASAAFSDDESDECEVTTQIMGALARRYSMDVPLNLLRRFNETTIINQQRLVRRGHDVALPMIAGGAAVFMFSMSLKTTGKGLAKSIGFIGMKTAIKQTALAAGCFAGLALSAWDLGRNIEEIKNNRTEASRSLRTAARKMEEETRKLRKMIDEQLEIIQKLSEFRRLLKDLGGYSLIMSKAGQKVLDYIEKTCHDTTIISWMIMNQIHFLNLFRFIRDHLLKHFEQEIMKRSRRHVHIVFVAHGCITDEFMPASLLVPPPSIEDTILYSPWNCYIDARAASGIAEGSIEPHLREFYNLKEPNSIFNYDRVPQRGNSMRESRNAVPQIYLGPVTPDEPVWKAFEELGGSVYRDDRIIVPYLQPDKNAPRIPFYMLVFGASYILEITRVKATVHLAACLGRGETRPMREEWEAQYAYTKDETVMSMNTNSKNVNRLLLQAFKMMFDNDDQQ